MKLPKLPLLLASCLFLGIWGTKLAVIDRFGSDLPYWDQWPGEGDVTFLPWLEQRQIWRTLATPHNEHRIAPTRLVNLGLLLVGGQWDARVQCVTNAALHAALAAFFFLWAWNRLSRGWALALALLLALTVAPPIPWEDVLAGFQSQFYFLIGFSLLAIANLLTARALSLRWWSGLACGGVALFTMGSGVLCAVPVVAVAGLRWLRRQTSRKDAALTIAVGSLIFLLGAWLHAPVKAHEPLHAHSAGAFLGYAMRCLAWPAPNWPWMAAIIWLPWLGLLGRWLKGLQSRSDPAADFVVAAGFWVLLQTAAVSYSRGGGSVLPSARYGDVTGLGVVLAFVALGILAKRTTSRLFAIAGGAYVVVAALCLAFATHSVWKVDLPKKKRETDNYERNVQAFMLTDDYTAFEKAELPFPAPDWLRDFLRRPKVPPLLPSSVRRPLPLDGFDRSALPVNPLPHRRYRAMTEAGEWRSAPLPVGRGWWKFKTAGHLGAQGTTLQIVARDRNRVLGSITPEKSAVNNWRAGYVRAPREPAVLLARTDGPAHWFAFSEPVEVSTLSYRILKFVKWGKWLALAAGAGGLAAAVFILIDSTGGRARLTE